MQNTLFSLKDYSHAKEKNTQRPSKETKCREDKKNIIILARIQ